MKPPREVPDWDVYYLGLAYMFAARSKDPHTQCGSIVVDDHHVPLGFGVNGAPRQINDHEIDWERPYKYPFMLHSEVNAIEHCRITTLTFPAGCTLYTTGHPCSHCMLRIVAKGISRVVYGPNKIACVPKEEEELSQSIADKGNVFVQKFFGSLQWLDDRVKSLKETGMLDK